MIAIWVLLASAIFVSAIVFVAPVRDRALNFASWAIADKNIKLTNNVAYGTGSRHKLDIYHGRGQSNSAARKPILLFYYGGGWVAGNKEFYQFVGATFAKRGFDVVIPDYRLYPDAKFAGFMNDAAKAYDWVAREMAAPEGRDVVVMGHSAGAHIAALLAYNSGYIAADVARPKAIVGLAGPYSFDPTVWPSTKEIFADVASADLARPVHFAGPNSPPSLLFHGDRDNVVKLWNQEELATALAANNVDHQTHTLVDTGHYKILFSLSRPMREKMGVVGQIIDFLDRFGGSGEFLD